MKVSRSGHYRYIQENETNRILKDFEVISKVREIHKRVKGKYGSRRMAVQLSNDGYPVGRSKARYLMKKAGIIYTAKKKFKVTTDSKHPFPVSPNLINREFSVSLPNKIWCSDITYIWTKQGWAYLAVVIDLFSRKVIGWSLKDHLRTSLTIEALSMAYFRRKPKPGLIHHSDRGSQYASYDYQSLLNDYHMIGSMSRKGDCWDNAVAESFFGTLKSELINDKTYETREELRVDVLEFIEMYYNSQRLHSTNGYLSPNTFEREKISKLA